MQNNLQFRERKKDLTPTLKEEGVSTATADIHVTMIKLGPSLSTITGSFSSSSKLMQEL